jgi:hypothetical protein
MSCSRFRRGVVVCVAFVVLDAAGCAPPPEDEGLEGPLLEAPGGAFVDVECNDKHRRFPIKSFSSGGVKYTRQGDNETFDRDGRCNRLEIDTNDHYKSGTHEFEGDVRIGDVSGQSVVQIFDASSSGPIMMVKAYSSGGGTLRKLAGSVTLATGIKGEWVRLRIVHNLGANTLTIYVNGDRKWSGSGGRGGGFNLKYGNYGTGASDVQWRGVSW